MHISAAAAIKVNECSLNATCHGLLGGIMNSAFSVVSSWWSVHSLSTVELEISCWGGINISCLDCMWEGHKLKVSPNSPTSLLVSLPFKFRLITVTHHITANLRARNAQEVRSVCHNMAYLRCQSKSHLAITLSELWSPILPSSSGGSSSSRVLVTHMANYRWMWGRWCELKACSHVAGVQTAKGSTVEGRGREKLINSWVPFSSPLPSSPLLSSPLHSSAGLWQIKDYFLVDQYFPLTSLYYSTVSIRVREGDAIFSS